MTVKQFCASQRQWRKILDDERKTRLIEFSNCLTMASCGVMATASPIYFIRENGWGYFNTGNTKHDVFPLLVMERMPLSFSQTMEYVTNNGENATLKPFTFVTKTYKQYLMYTNRRDFPSLSLSLTLDQTSLPLDLNISSLSLSCFFSPFFLPCCSTSVNFDVCRIPHIGR